MEGKFRRATRIREYFNNLESRVASGEREEQPDVYDKNDWWFAALCTILLSQRGIIRAKEYFSSSEEIVFSNESLSLSFPLSSSIDILFLDIICRRISPRTNENNPFSSLPTFLETTRHESNGYNVKYVFSRRSLVRSSESRGGRLWRRKSGCKWRERRRFPSDPKRNVAFEMPASQPSRANGIARVYKPGTRREKKVFTGKMETSL